MLKPIGSLTNQVDQEEKVLTEYIQTFYNDPLGFVHFAYPWGEGSLAEEEGPDEWQSAYLLELGSLCQSIGLEGAIRMATASGHGVGKTCVVAWIIHWFMSTRVNCVVVVTANTQNQLNTKTWREVSKWHSMAINRHWFSWTATKFFHVLNPSTWAATAIPWSEHNSEAFAGTHEKSVLLIFDEASAISDKIWEVAEGAMTTDGAVWLTFGNPTKNSGYFYECFNSKSHRWKQYKVDSRKAKAANQNQIAQWIEDYGEDSDFVRVRVRGEFPRASSDQLISPELVRESMKTKVDIRKFEHQRAIIGVDVARFGTDQSVIVVRQGGYVHEPICFRGLDTQQLSARVIDVFQKWGQNAIVCVDGVGVGAGVVDTLYHRSVPVVDVQSAAKSLDFRTYSNKRAELYGRFRDWLMAGGILYKNDDLYKQLCSINYHFNNRMQLQLENKDDIRKETGVSPDLSDAVAYTFAYDEAQAIMMSQRPRRIIPVVWS